MILGYLWLVEFSKFHYDHTLAGVSAFASALAFLVPALFITSPIRQRFILSARALDHLLSFILVLAATVVAVGAFYNFRLVGIADIYNFRDELEFPAWLRYAMGATSNALLPFAFACFVARGNRWRAAGRLLLLLLFYPITLTKLTLFAPVWLLFLALLSRLLRSQNSPSCCRCFCRYRPGLSSRSCPSPARSQYELIHQYFGTINFRMIAFPSSRARFVQRFLFDARSHAIFARFPS